MHTAVEVGSRAVHGCHAQGMRRPLEHLPEHVAGNGVGKVGAELGWLRANLDLGPKSKVVAHLMIYKSH